MFCLDADAIGHNVYRPGSMAVQDVAQEFGQDILTDAGEVDRPKLGSIVFGQRDAMKKLESIVWPHVQKDVEDQITLLRSEWEASSDTNKHPVVVVEAAVLLDAGWQDTFLDAVWVVTTPEEQALDRIVETRNTPREQAQQRINAQKERRGIGNLDQEVERKVVTAVIENSGTLDDLKEALSQRLLDPKAWNPSIHQTH